MSIIKKLLNKLSVFINSPRFNIAFSRRRGKLSNTEQPRWGKCIKCGHIYDVKNRWYCSECHSCGVEGITKPN